MRKFWPQISFFFLIIAAITLACGTSKHTLQSIAITPAVAEGQAQFTAIGYYNSAPSPAKLVSATWGACAQDWEPTSEVSVSSTGLAHCSTGASGVFTVFAFQSLTTGVTCNVVLPCGPPPCSTIANTAKLTCP